MTVTPERLGSAIGAPAFGSEIAEPERPPPTHARPSARRPLGGVAIAAVLAIVLRIPFLSLPAYPDEGGYLLVASHWHLGGPGLYGDLWVDRPPLLMLFWRLASLMGGVEAARWLACGLVAVLVVSAGWCGWLLAGRRGAQWSAVVAAALATSPMLATQEVNGELLAAPLVMVGCLAALKAVRLSDSPQARAVWAVGAGLAGTAAVLMKQNFVDPLIFAGVLLLMLGVRRNLPWRQVLRTAGWGVAGALIPVVATAVWAWTSGAGVSELWFTLYGFRSDAAHVIMSHGLTAPERRLSQLIGFAAFSGVIVLAVSFLWFQRRGLLRDPVGVAISAMMVVGFTGITIGGSYWPHYLVGLIPVLSLAAAALATDSSSRQVSRTRGSTLFKGVVVSAVVASSVVATGIATVTATPVKDTRTSQVAASLRAFAHPHDTVIVAYGHANLIESAGLEPGYRYMWSLPMRTLDPDLSLLVRTVSGRSAPTWFVRWESLDSWKIDANRQLSDAVEAHYRPAAQVCGVTIYLHDGVDRPVVPSSTSCR